MRWERVVVAVAVAVATVVVVVGLQRRVREDRVSAE